MGGDEGDGSRLDQGAGVAARGSRQGHQARYRRRTGGGGQKVASERDPAQLVKRRAPRDALSRGRIPSRAHTHTSFPSFRLSPDALSRFLTLLRTTATLSLCRVSSHRAASLSSYCYILRVLAYVDQLMRYSV